VAVVGVVGCAAGGLEALPDGLITPLLGRGHQVTVTLTPSAYRWLETDGTVDRIEKKTGFEARSTPRLPSQPRPHPEPDVLVVAPATASTVAKLALGIADNQALTVLVENVAYKPMVVFPRVNAGHARHPAWAGHMEALRSAGVDLVYGDDVWPLFEPREAPPGRPLPWPSILARVEAALRER
jgi:phosphopantothenoylcysteine synthetase/decarboxylase